MNMVKSHTYQGGMLAAVALMLVSLVSLPSSAQPSSALFELLSRAQIENLLANYYAQFSGTGSGFGSFYTEHGVLDVNGIVRRGRKPIEDLYKTIPPDHGKVNVTFANLRIVVRGNTASYHLIWTEFISKTPTTVPQILEQGRDRGKLVKRDAKWLISCRVVTNDGGLPADLLKGYSQRKSIHVCQ